MKETNFYPKHFQVSTHWERTLFKFKFMEFISYRGKMKESFKVLLCLTFIFSVSLASEASVEETKRSEASIIKQNREIEARLSRQLKWFEPAKVIFHGAKRDKEDQPDLADEGRFLKVVQTSGGSVSHVDMLFQVLTTALKDFGDIKRAIADKFVQFVNENEATLLAIQVGSQRLNTILNSFANTATNRARTAAAASVAAGGGGGGLLGGILGGGGGGGLLSGLLSGLGS